MPKPETIKQKRIAERIKFSKKRKAERYTDFVCQTIRRKRPFAMFGFCCFPSFEDFGNILVNGKFRVIRAAGQTFLFWEQNELDSFLKEVNPQNIWSCQDRFKPFVLSLELVKKILRDPIYKQMGITWSDLKPIVEGKECRKLQRNKSSGT